MSLHATVLWNFTALSFRSGTSGAITATSSVLYLGAAGFSGVSPNGITATNGPNGELSCLTIPRGVQALILFRIACDNFEFMRWYQGDELPIPGSPKATAYKNTPLIAELNPHIEVVGWSASTLAIYDANQEDTTINYLLKMASTASETAPGEASLTGTGFTDRTGIGWWDPQIQNDGTGQDGPPGS